MDLEMEENNQIVDKKLIDVEKIISKKNPKLLKIIPRFVIKYLKRILHQDEVNAAISRNTNKYGCDFVDAILAEFKANVRVINPEKIPTEGRYIIASNHPLGGLDAMALMSMIGKKRRDFKFIVNDILLFLENLRTVFIPVNKHGGNPKEYAQILHNTFTNEGLILMFPAGLVSRKQKGGIKDLEWKKSFISKSKQYKLNIIPVYIDGKNSNFFYNLSWIRKKLFIKANIEMLYLVDEMYKQKNKNINIYFGEPIDYNSFDKTKSDLEWAQVLKDKVYNLNKQISC